MFLNTFFHLFKISLGFLYAAERVQRVAFGYGSSIPGTQFSASNGNNSWRQGMMLKWAITSMISLLELLQYYELMNMIMFFCNPDKAHSNLRENKEYKEPWVGVLIFIFIDGSRGSLSSSHLLYLIGLPFHLCLNSLKPYWILSMLLQNYYSYYPVTLPLRRPYSGNPGTSQCAKYYLLCNINFISYYSNRDNVIFLYFFQIFLMMKSSDSCLLLMKVHLIQLWSWALW